MEFLYYLIALIILLALLYYFSRLIIRYLTIISVLLFHNSRIAIYAYSIFFLPGILLHELSHFLMAAALGVPTGQINLFPKKMEGEGEQWLMGSVQSAETDPLRANLIGIAPMLVGSGALASIVRIGQIWPISPMGILFLYLLLAIANNMFLSPQDRKSIWAIPSLLLILATIGFLVGQIVEAGQWIIALSQQFLPFLQTLVLSFGITAVVDFVFIAILAMIIKLASQGRILES